MVKVNDIVRFLNDVGGGRVTRVDGNMVYVEDSDGLCLPGRRVIELCNKKCELCNRLYGTQG